MVKVLIEEKGERDWKEVEEKERKGERKGEVPVKQNRKPKKFYYS